MCFLSLCLSLVFSLFLTYTIIHFYPLISTPSLSVDKADKAWTIVMHDRINGIKVTGSTVDRPYIGDVNYWNASWDDVTALANTSMYCEQWIDYSCYKSRILNTPSE